MYAGNRGAGNRRADDFDPIHPYTKKLMGSIIVPEEGMKGHKLAAIPGTPPNLKNVPEGCRFADRCSYAQDDCRKGKITSRTVGIESIGASWSRMCLGVVCE